MKNLLIIDGNSILNRAYYAIRPLTTKEGLHTNAILGFVTTLLKHIETYYPSYGAVAFDLPAPTFRHKEFAGYKASRKGMPDELAAQLPYAKKCSELLGFKVITMEGYEADDIIGAAVSLARGADEQVHSYILTGDRDLLQLINDDTSVLLAMNSDAVLFDREKFISEYGIDPSLFVGVKALMGDNSDNIPGVEGVGEKTAFKLISAYGTLDALYNAAETAESSSDIKKSLKQKLINGKEDAYRSLFLSTIDANVPLALSLDDITCGGYNRNGLMELFTKLEFTALIRRLNLSSSSDAVIYEKIKPSDINKIRAKGVITAEIKGDSLYIISDSANYCCDFTDIKELKPLFENRDHAVNVFDSKSMYSLLAGNGIGFLNCAFDVMLAAYVLNSSDHAYDLQRLSLAYLNTVYDKTTADGAFITHQLYKKISGAFSAEEYELYKTIEFPLAAVLSDMERYGFKVDRAGLAGFSRELQTLADEYAERIYLYSGDVFNINSPKQLGEILFDRLKLPVSKKNKTHYSTDAETLEKLRPYSPVIIDSITDYRQVTKLKSTYADGLLKVADPNGRVHTTFNQTGAATGRLSSAEPNLQNIPIRQDLGRELRKFFLPESADYVLIDADYSQIELRLLADISGDETMINAFTAGEDIHALTASQVFGVDKAGVTPELRKRAKAVNFGVIYGISDFSLSEDMGVSRYHAGEYIKSYFEKYPGVNKYMKDVIAGAYKNGYVTTRFGRRRYIPELKSTKVSLKNFGERVAMNSPIQGTAADIIKIAMINADRELKKADIDARLILQVHDELIVESHKNCKDRAAEILKSCMENIPGFKVPLVVEMSIGENWFAH